LIAWVLFGFQLFVAIELSYWLIDFYSWLLLLLIVFLFLLYFTSPGTHHETQYYVDHLLENEMKTGASAIDMSFVNLIIF